MSNLIIVSGIILVIVGLLVKIFETKIINLPILPGDILIKKENFIFYFPITTSIIISIIISLIIFLIFKK